MFGAATIQQVAYLADPLAKAAVPLQPPAQAAANAAASPTEPPNGDADTKPAAKADAEPTDRADKASDPTEGAPAGKPASGPGERRGAAPGNLLPATDGAKPAAPQKDATTDKPSDSAPPAAPGRSIFDLPPPTGSARPGQPRPVLDLPALPGEPPRAPPVGGQPAGGRPAGGQPAEGEEVRAVLPLRSVIESVYYSFPALEAAMREADIAEGKQLAASGEFDLKVKAESMSLAEGFYDNYRNLVKLEQALMPGGHVFGQYRIGDGSFPEYYRDRETNEGGEFKIGMQTPLMRNRAIDQRRADIFQATLRREQVDPFVQGLLLEFTYGAADAYWSWVTAGLSYDAQRNLLRVTEERNKQFEERVKQQDLAEIELVQNERLIASRQAKVIEAERKLQQAAIKLSLFFRDGQGRPVLPSPAMLPSVSNSKVMGWSASGVCPA